MHDHSAYQHFNNHAYGRILDIRSSCSIESSQKRTWLSKYFRVTYKRTAQLFIKTLLKFDIKQLYVQGLNSLFQFLGMGTRSFSSWWLFLVNFHLSHINRPLWFARRQLAPYVRWRSTDLVCHCCSVLHQRCLIFVVLEGFRPTRKSYMVP